MVEYSAICVGDDFVLVSRYTMVSGQTKSPFIYEFTVSSAYDGAPRHAVSPRVIWKGIREKTSAHGIPHMDNAHGKVIIMFCSVQVH